MYEIRAGFFDEVLRTVARVVGGFQLFFHCVQTFVQLVHEV